MVGEAEASGTEFGIVRTVARGEETGIANTGCTVTVERVVARYPDGRFDVITRGRRRFRVLSLDDEREYLRGEVEYFGDDPAGSPAPETLRLALEAHTRLMQELQSNAEPPDPALPALSFRLADEIDDLEFRSRLLQSTSEDERLRIFSGFVSDYIPKHQYIAHMKIKAPTNGAGHKRES